jgi:hypothetical protein
MSDKNLRKKLIRLAHTNPELRKDLLPLLKEAAETPNEWFDAFSDWWGGIKNSILADDDNEVRNSLGWDLYQICVGYDQSSKSRKDNAQRAIDQFSKRLMKEIDVLNKKADDLKK